MRFRKSTILKNLLQFSTVLFVLALTPMPAQAIQLTSEERAEAVDRIAKMLNDHYVFPDVANASGAHLQQKLREGAFEKLEDPRAFAESLTRVLQSVNKDKHMRVYYREPQAGNGQPLDRDARRQQMMQRQRERNFGFHKLEKLDGNVGYLDLRGFSPVDLAAPMGEAAMRFLSTSDAIIIDLRRNGGGSPAMVQFLCSYFFDQKIHLNSLYWRGGDRTEEFWTLADIPGERMPEVPLFVLTSNYTFSGGEEFAYNMQTRKRAMLIGETTGGGANPGQVYPVNHRFEIFIPTGRAINPVTGTNWEGVGVKPEVEAASEASYDIAVEKARVAAEKYRGQREAKAAAIVQEMRAQLATARQQLQSDKNTGQRLVLEALKNGLQTPLVNEMFINQLGYQYLEEDDPAMAIAVFMANCKLFPESGNVYDSLGEAYMISGDKPLAIKNYKKSLELNPGNRHGIEMLKKLGVSM